MPRFYHPETLCPALTKAISETTFTTLEIGRKMLLRDVILPISERRSAFEANANGLEVHAFFQVDSPR
jgi:hypothetical protein